MNATYLDPKFIGPILPPQHLPLEQKKAILEAILSHSVARQHLRENYSD